MNKPNAGCSSCGGGKGKSTIPTNLPKPPRPVNMPRPKR